jgi:hypothetical protein
MPSRLPGRNRPAAEAGEDHHLARARLRVGGAGTAAGRERGEGSEHGPASDPPGA